MIKDYLSDYKKEVQAKFEEEKKGINSSIFINPSRAKLRNLCIEIFKDNANADDLNSFASFFGFQFNPEHTNKLRDTTNTDKFRPIETFLKGETDLADIEGVNLAAILVDFKYRPYLKYSKRDDVEITKKIEKGEIGGGKRVKGGQGIVALPSKKSSFNLIDWMCDTKARLMGTIGVLMISVFGITIYAVDDMECMQWQEDHFELVYCETNLDNPNSNPKISIDKELLDFRKIKISDTTTFFKNDKAVVWYCKSGDELECFNGPGAGFHPITGKTLRPITDHMIDKYIHKQ